MNDSIILSEYQINWAEQFFVERARLQEAFGGLAISIEHIGSTSIPDLAAKPILDILVGMEDLSLLTQDRVVRLEKVGYAVLGECGIPGRIFCRKGTPRTHHLHIVQEGTEVWNKHLLFRDYMRAHREDAKEYETLKRSLAERFKDDRTMYTEGKHEFITKIMQKAHVWQSTQTV